MQGTKPPAIPRNSLINRLLSGHVKALNQLKAALTKADGTNINVELTARPLRLAKTRSPRGVDSSASWRVEPPSGMMRMGILSLGRNLNASEDRMRELIVLLLSGFRLHAIGQDENRRAEFQSELARIEEQLSRDAKVEAISILVGQAIHCIDSYHRSVVSHVATSLSEYKQLALELTQSIGRMAAGNTSSVEKLQSIEKQMGVVNSVSDIRLLRHNLSDCLTELCDKTVQYRQNANSSSVQLAEQTEGSRPASPSNC